VKERSQFLPEVRSLSKSKVPSPCIDVCKYKANGHCIGCSMTEKQKKAFKKLDGEKRKLAFLGDLLRQQATLGDFRHWHKAYARKCRKKGEPNPVERLTEGAEAA